MSLDKWVLSLVLIAYSLPILVTHYDPVNKIGYAPCGVDDCETFADTTPVTPEAFGNVAACIMDWHQSTITIPGVGTYYCADTGANVQVEFNEYYGEWVIRMDLVTDLSQYPPNTYPENNYWLYRNYSIKWWWQ